MARRWGTTMFTVVALFLLGALVIGWRLYPANSAIRKEVVGSAAKSPVAMEAAQQQQLIQDLKKEVAQMKVQLKQAHPAEPQGFWLDTQCANHEVTQSNFPSVDEVLKKSGSKVTRTAAATCIHLHGAGGCEYGQ
jgi:hypothetical protein